MGLRETTSSLAARHTHALVVEVPGSWRTRVAVERSVLGRGWRLAASPADADVLVVCGAPGRRLEDSLELVWHQMPGPRVRLDIGEYDDVGARLDEARAALLDTARHRHDALIRPGASDLLQSDDQGDEMDHGEMDHREMDHEGMDHGDMEMSPGGIPLAEGGEDRDGLEMDVLDVRLGPVLPHWPAGLVLRCSLQGDVITSAAAEVLDGPRPPDGGSPRQARRLDNLVSLLALAGWDDAAAEARRARDAALARPATETVSVDVSRLTRRVRRSRLLRWSLRGLRRVTEEDARQHGLPPDVVGDTYDRLVGMLDRAAADASGGGRRHGAATSFSTDHLARLVTGLDLATARLVVASLDIEHLEPAQREHEASHG